MRVNVTNGNIQLKNRKVLTMEIANENNYKYIDTDRLQDYEKPEREAQYMQYLANQSRKELAEYRHKKLNEAIQNNDIDYLKYVCKNVPTYKLIKLLIRQIFSRIF